MNLPPPRLLPDGCLVICLPIPARAISPNAKRGQSKWAAIRKSRIVKAHRERARLEMVSALAKFDLSNEWAGYSLAHFFKTAAVRDDDNADGACKAYRDGIADALRRDDRHLPKMALSTIGKDATCARVEVIIYGRPGKIKL